MATPPQAGKTAPERPFPALIDTGRSSPKAGLSTAVCQRFRRQFPGRSDDGLPAARSPGSGPVRLRPPPCSERNFRIQEDGSARLHVRRSKTDPEAEGAALYIGSDAASALVAIKSEGFAVVDPSTPVFGLSASQIGRRVNAAAKAAGLGDGFTGHSGRVGMAQDLAAAGVELPALMTAGRWKSSRMPRYYQGRGGDQPGHTHGPATIRKGPGAG